MNETFEAVEFPFIVEARAAEAAEKHRDEIEKQIEWWRSYWDWEPTVGEYCSINRIIVPLKDGGNSPYCIYENAMINVVDWEKGEVIATLDHWPSNRTREEWAASFGYKNGAVLRMSFLDFGPQIYDNAPIT